MNAISLVILIVVVIAYIDLGGMVFHFLEYENDKVWYEKSSKIHRTFLANHTCMSEAQLKVYFYTILDSYKHGILPWEKNATDWTWNMWDYASGVLYSMTVISTIGFANMVPTDDWSKIFLVIFSFFGIPIFFAMVNATGKTLYKSFFRCCLSKKGNICSVGRVLGLVLVMMLGIAMFVVLPSVLFYFVEEWPFIDSLFHSYLMVSTMGSAQHHIGINPRIQYYWWYKVLCSVWLLLAFIWVFVVVHSWLAVIKDINRKFSGDAHALKDKYGKVPHAHSTVKDWRYSDQASVIQRSDSSYEYDQNRNNRRKSRRLDKVDSKVEANHVVENDRRISTHDRRSDYIIENHEPPDKRDHTLEQNHINYDANVRKSKRRRHHRTDRDRKEKYEYDNDRFEYEDEFADAVKKSRHHRRHDDRRRSRHSSEEESRDSSKKHRKRRN